MAIDMRMWLGSLLLFGGVEAMGAEATPELHQRYADLIQTQIQANLVFPEGLAQLACMVVVVQERGGMVRSTEIIEPCEVEPAQVREAVHISLRRAVFRAEPLPYAGYESVFQPEIQLTFTHQQ